MDRFEDKVKKVNGVNKVLNALFHMGKGKRIKGKGFMVMSIDEGEADMVVKLGLDLHQVSINRM